MCFRSWGNKKELKITSTVPEAKRRKVSKKRKQPTTSRATATSSEIRNEGWLGNLSPRRSLVISTRAVTTVEEKKPDGSGSQRDWEYW